MIDTIYFEEKVAEHPRTISFFKRFPQADRIPCSHYKEIFNPSGQNFRLQKKKTCPNPCKKYRQIDT